MARKPGRLLVLAVLFCCCLVLPVMGKPVTIYFFPGGDPGELFATVVYNGARAAAEVLGDLVDVKYMWSGWSPQKMVSQFQQAVAARPDGIAIMGFPGDEAFRPFVLDAEKQGIIVTSSNSELVSLEGAYSGKGFGYVGASNYDAGLALGRAAIREGNLKKGDKALVWGHLGKPVKEQRTKGIVEAFTKAGLKVDTLVISNEIEGDASLGIPVITGYLQANLDCKVLVTDSGQLTSSQQVYLETAGRGPNDIYAAGFDLSPTAVRSIKNGYTDLVLDQQPFLQGFLPIMQIYLTKLYGFSGLHVDTGGGLINKDNIDLVADLAKKGLR
jgi:simple sugar transport system substrate-binding protein